MDQTVTVIVDYGMGNLGSIQNMIRKAGFRSILSSDIQDIRQAEKLILPGVGAFDAGMTRLNELGLVTALEERVIRDKVPILGICLGLQLFSNKSEEGVKRRLGWIDADTARFRFENGSGSLKIPHMGWNTVQTTRESRLFRFLPEDARFYFVHSYHVLCGRKDDEVLKTRYGYDFTSAVEHDNIYGVQFHPEKSHKFGMRMLKNFLELT